MATGSDSSIRESTSNFIRDALSPVVAVITSLDVEKCLEKNNLSFAELLAPFSQLSVDGSIKDPNNQNHVIKNLALDFRDLRREGFLKNGALNLALKELVRSIQGNRNVDDKPQNGALGQNVKGRKTAPWYDQYRRQFTRLLEPSEHEFLRNYLACILVVSTEHPDPLDQFIRLGQAQHALQHQGAAPQATPLALPKHAAPPKWFSTNIFKYHLLIHDVSTGNDSKAESIFQSMKMSYGAHACHLLRLNSSLDPDTLAEATPLCDPWAGILRYRLRHFDSIRCFRDEDEKINQSSTSNGFSLANDEEECGVVEKPQTAPILAPNAGGECIPHPLSSSSLNRLVDDVSGALDQSSKSSMVVRHGQRLTSGDLDRVKIFVQEFCLRGLLPFVERQLRLLNDQISSRRSLISKSSLVSSARRWFTGGGSSPNFLPPTATSPSSESPSPATAIFNAESVELQTRRLADLAFLFQNYEMAYHLYYSLKKEFTHAGAWLHQAGAAEMASLCVFLAGPSTISNAFPVHYMDDALKSYGGVCNRPFSAIRAAIFGSEILIAHNTREFLGEAASLYIRMTATVSLDIRLYDIITNFHFLRSQDDLSGALFLERAAWCFAEAGLYKKSALHLTLAGYRFKKGGLHPHGERCYRLARAAYCSRGWKFAEGHIEHMLNNDQKIADPKYQSATVNSENLIDFQNLSSYLFSNSYLRHVAESYTLLTSRKRFPDLIANPNYVYKTGGDVSKDFGRENLVTDEENSTKFHCTVECQSTFEHDFSKKSVCLIPITIEVEDRGDQISTVNLRLEHSKISDHCTLQSQIIGPTVTLSRPPILKTLNILAISPSSATPISKTAQWRIYAYICAPGVYDATSKLMIKCEEDAKLQITVPRRVVTVRNFCKGENSM